MEKKGSKERKCWKDVDIFLSSSRSHCQLIVLHMFRSNSATERSTKLSDNERNYLHHVNTLSSGFNQRWGRLERGAKGAREADEER